MFLILYTNIKTYFYEANFYAQLTCLSISQRRAHKALDLFRTLLVDLLPGKPRLNQRRKPAAPAAWTAPIILAERTLYPLTQSLTQGGAKRKLTRRSVKQTALWAPVGRARWLVDWEKDGKRG